VTMGFWEGKTQDMAYIRKISGCSICSGTQCRVTAIYELTTYELRQICPVEHHAVLLTLASVGCVFERALPLLSKEANPPR
jgi:hypothetical protein